MLSKPLLTIKGGSCHAKKRCKVLIMKAAKLGLAGPGAGLEQSKSGAEVRAGQEQGRNRAVAE